MEARFLANRTRAGGTSGKIARYVGSNPMADPVGHGSSVSLGTGAFLTLMCRPKCRLSRAEKNAAIMSKMASRA